MNVVSTTVTKDAMRSTFLYCLIHQESLEEMSEWVIAAGGVEKVSIPGTGLFRMEVVKELKKQIDVQVLTK